MHVTAGKKRTVGIVVGPLLGLGFVFGFVIGLLVLVSGHCALAASAVDAAAARARAAVRLNARRCRALLRSLLGGYAEGKCPIAGETDAASSLFRPILKCRLRHRLPRAAWTPHRRRVPRQSPPSRPMTRPEDARAGLRRRACTGKSRVSRRGSSATGGRRRWPRP